MDALQEVTAFAPATVANVASGFDVLGFALSQPGDTVTARFVETPGVTVTEITGDGGRLPTAAEQNTASVAVIALIDRLKELAQSESLETARLALEKLTQRGIALSIVKDMPLGSGMGSSAASAAAALVAANTLLGNPLTKTELVPCAMEGERIACGAAHGDNVAPALLGNFTLIRGYAPLDLVVIPAPEELYCALIHPDIEIKTADARRVLRRQLTLAQATIQWGNLAGLVAGLYTKDYPLIGRSLTDVVVEPERSLLIPGFNDAKTQALSAGALGCSISGSGPSLFALCQGEQTASAVADRMVAVFKQLGFECEQHVSAINPHGAVVLGSR